MLQPNPAGNSSSAHFVMLVEAGLLHAHGGVFTVTATFTPDAGSLAAVEDVSLDVLLSWGGMNNVRRRTVVTLILSACVAGIRPGPVMTTRTRSLALPGPWPLRPPVHVADSADVVRRDAAGARCALI